LVAALAIALATITTNNVCGSDAPSEEALPVAEQDIAPSPPTFDPLVPEITDLEEAESVTR
jgi:hypothetical protein